MGDANDNPPRFDRRQHVASIDEGQVHFQPRLVLKAQDLDESSVLQFKILDGNINNLFALNSQTGEISVALASGLRYEKWLQY